MSVTFNNTFCPFLHAPSIDNLFVLRTELKSIVVLYKRYFFWRALLNEVRKILRKLYTIDRNQQKNQN